MRQALHHCGAERAAGCLSRLRPATALPLQRRASVTNPIHALITHGRAAKGIFDKHWRALYAAWVSKSTRKSPPAVITDLIRALLVKQPDATAADIQQRMLKKHGLVVSRQSVQYARRVPRPKAPGRPRKNITCPQCGHEFHARFDV